MDIIGNIYSREAAEQKKETFRVQEFMLDASYFDNYNQTNRENFRKMQVKNANIDKLAALRWLRINQPLLLLLHHKKPTSRCLGAN